MILTVRLLFAISSRVLMLDTHGIARQQRILSFDGHSLTVLQRNRALIKLPPAYIGSELERHSLHTLHTCLDAMYSQRCMAPLLLSLQGCHSPAKSLSSSWSIIIRACFVAMVYLYHPPEHTLHLPGGPTIPFRVGAVLSKHAYGSASFHFWAFP